MAKNRKSDDSILGPLAEAVGQAGSRVRDLGEQAGNAAVEAVRDAARRAWEFTGERAEPLADLVRTTGTRLGLDDPSAQARAIRDSVRGRLADARAQLAPYESRVQQGIDALRGRLDLASGSDLADLRQRVDLLEKRLGESRRAA